MGVQATQLTCPSPQWVGVPRGQGREAPRTLSPTLLPAARVQEELDRVLGPGRPPRPEDQRSLPYTNAVLHEVQRFITLLPHVPRCTATDTRLGGYLLPKVGRPGLIHNPEPSPDPHSLFPLPLGVGGLLGA